MVQPPTICSAVDGAKAGVISHLSQASACGCLSIPARQTSVPDGGIYRVVSLFYMTRTPKEALGWPAHCLTLELWHPPPTVTVAETEV